jgi:hypothetical protein
MVRPLTIQGYFFSHELTRMYTNKKIIYKDLSYKVIGLAMEVHRKLGYGFLEKVYENSSMVLFRRDKIPAVQQAPINLRFESEIVGNYIAAFFLTFNLPFFIKWYIRLEPSSFHSCGNCIDPLKALIIC